MATIILALAAVPAAGCRQQPVAPSTTATTQSALPTPSPYLASDADGQNVLPPPSPRHKYDAYGPFQWSPFTGVNRDSIFDAAATKPATNPANDSVLYPTDDATW